MKLFIHNALIFICIIALIFIWFFLHPKENTTAFEVQDDTDINHSKIALVISKSGYGQEIGQSLEHGVKHYLKELESKSGGNKVGIVVYDDESNPKKAKEIAEKIVKDKHIIAVLGHSNNETTLAAVDIYNKAGVPMLTPSADAYKITKNNEWAFSTIMSDKEQGEFIALYVEHALEGKKVVMFARETDNSSALLTEFHQVAKKDGITVVDYIMPESEKHINILQKEDLINQIKEVQPDVVYLSLNENHTEDILIILKEISYQHQILANNSIGTAYFTKRFEKFPEEKHTPGFYTNGIIVPVPFILDMAGEHAQKENQLYFNKFGHDMSWSYAYGYDSIKVLIEALKRSDININNQQSNITDIRLAIRKGLRSMNQPEKGVKGLTGTHFFGHLGNGEHPPLFAVFRAGILRPYLNQFSVNDMSLAHLDSLDHTSHFVVDDKIFGLSNIVYTGLKFNVIKDININNRSVFADFDVWFRYHGDFDPSLIEFEHIAEKGLSTEILNEHTIENINYKKIRVRGLFNFHLSATDFLQNKLHFIFSFRHKNMNKNELTYIVDRFSYNNHKFNISMIDQMTNDDVLQESEEAILDASTMNEDTKIIRAFGDPRFMDGELPFSHFNTKISLHNKDISLSRKIDKVISKELALTLLLFSMIILFIVRLSFINKFIYKNRAIINYFSIGGILIGSEILFFIEQGNYLNLDLNTLEIIVKIFESIWYIFAAVSINIFFSYFLWSKIQKSTGYPIPSIAKTLVKLNVYFFAILMIYSIVFDLSITSILAASGALSIILGFALKELILDFFSGLVLNIEKPLHIGDYCQFPVGKKKMIEGFVEEMNWRTVRVKDKNGFLLVIPNSKVSVDYLINMSLEKYIKFPINIYLNTKYDPKDMVGILKHATKDNPYIVNAEKFESKVGYKGYENIGEEWVARYKITIYLSSMSNKSKAVERLWENVWAIFEHKNLSILPIYPETATNTLKHI